MCGDEDCRWECKMGRYIWLGDWSLAIPGCSTGSLIDT